MFAEVDALGYVNTWRWRTNGYGGAATGIRTSSVVQVGWCVMEMHASLEVVLLFSSWLPAQVLQPRIMLKSDAENTVHIPAAKYIQYCPVA